MYGGHSGSAGDPFAGHSHGHANGYFVPRFSNPDCAHHYSGPSTHNAMHPGFSARATVTPTMHMHPGFTARATATPAMPSHQEHPRIQPLARLVEEILLCITMVGEQLPAAGEEPNYAAEKHFLKELNRLPQMLQVVQYRITKYHQVLRMLKIDLEDEDSSDVIEETTEIQQKFKEIFTCLVPADQGFAAIAAAIEFLECKLAPHAVGYPQLFTTVIKVEGAIHATSCKYFEFIDAVHDIISTTLCNYIGRAVCDFLCYRRCGPMHEHALRIAHRLFMVWSAKDHPNEMLATKTMIYERLLDSYLLRLFSKEPRSRQGNQPISESLDEKLVTLSWALLPTKLLAVLGLRTSDSPRLQLAAKRVLSLRKAIVIEVDRGTEQRHRHLWMRGKIVRPVKLSAKDDLRLPSPEQPETKQKEIFKGVKNKSNKCGKKKGKKGDKW